MSVHKKLQAARIALYAMGLKQSGINKHSGMAYYELIDFTVDAQRIFNDVGLSSTFNMTSENAVLAIVDTDDGSKADFSCPVYFAALAKEPEKSVKNLGATITYLRRYLWMLALEIPQKEVVELVKNHEKTEVDNKPPLPPYPDERFNENFEGMAAKIRSGETTAARTINAIQSLFTMTKKQIDTLTAVV